MLVLYTFFFLIKVFFASFFFIMKVGFCRWVHSMDFRKYTTLKGIFHSFKSSSEDPQHAPTLNCIYAKVLLSSTYTEAGATGLNLPRDLPPVIQTTAAKTWGQLFCWYIFFPFVSIPASSSHEKRNSACQSCRESFLPSPVMRG